MTTTPTPTLTRRTALLSSASGLLVALAGCSDDTTDTNPDNGSSSAGPLSSVAVDGTELVVEFDPDAGATALSIVDPTGESVAHRDLPAGVQRESVELGTAYEPGVFDVLLLADDEEIASVEHEIRPELVLTDLKLGRNHPEEMYEGAGDQTIRTETILTVKNEGSGPDRITSLRFEGDVPRPTPDDFDESGIANVDDDVSRYDSPIILSGEELRIYSAALPFVSSGTNVSCSSEGTNGEFQVLIQSDSAPTTRSAYEVVYTGDGLLECDIEITEADE